MILSNVNAFYMVKRARGFVSIFNMITYKILLWSSGEGVRPEIGGLQVSRKFNPKPDSGQEILILIAQQWLLSETYSIYMYNIYIDL